MVSIATNMKFYACQQILCMSTHATTQRYAYNTFLIKVGVAHKRSWPTVRPWTIINNQYD